MAMVGGAGMEVVDGMHVGQSQGGWSHVGRCRSTSRVHSDAMMTLDHTAVQVRSSGYGQVGIGWSSGEGHNTGCHEKAPVCCPCSRLATLHGHTVVVDCPALTGFMKCGGPDAFSPTSIFTKCGVKLA